jgi:hypothetical protein
MLALYARAIQKQSRCLMQTLLKEALFLQQPDWQFKQAAALLI